MQEQFYQLWESAPESSAYNSGFYLCLEGALDLDMLQAAVRMLFERQQVGRTQARGFSLLFCLPCTPLHGHPGPQHQASVSGLAGAAYAHQQGRWRSLPSHAAHSSARNP
jgi:hypothetical protein